MASEKERAREEYLRIRELALKEDKKERLWKILADILYMLTSLAVVIAGIYVATKWTDLEGSSRTVSIVLCVVAGAVCVVLAGLATKQMLKHKKALHDHQQKLDDLESKYHL